MHGFKDVHLAHVDLQSCCTGELKDTFMVHSWIQRYIPIAYVDYKIHLCCTCELNDNSHVACMDWKIHSCYTCKLKNCHGFHVNWKIHSSCMCGLKDTVKVHARTDWYIHDGHVNWKIPLHCLCGLEDVFMLQTYWKIYICMDWHTLMLDAQTEIYIFMLHICIERYSHVTCMWTTRYIHVVYYIDWKIHVLPLQN